MFSSTEIQKNFKAIAVKARQIIAQSVEQISIRGGESL